MAVNNRVYYAIQQVSFGKDSSGLVNMNAGADYDSTDSAAKGNRHVAHGVQSVGLTTTFNLEQVFELGQLAIYDNVEGTPDIEVTMTKVMDGYIPLWCLATSDQTDGPQLAKRCSSTVKSIVQLGIWDEAMESAGQEGSGARTFVSMSGLYPTSISYNFPVDDNFTEDITLVGNSKVWGSGQSTSTLECNPSYFPTNVTGGFSGNDDSPIGTGGIQRRENVIFATGNAGATTEAVIYAECSSPDKTVLPADIPGVYDGSSNPSMSSGVKNTVHIQSVTVSTDVAREELFELGAKLPYARPVTFPIEVTCDFETTTSSGDMINAIDGCSGTAQSCGSSKSLSNRAIRIATCDGLRIWLGKKNKLASVTYGGGDAGGGNATVTYSYTTFNDFTVIHPYDIFESGGSASGANWWKDRPYFLGSGLLANRQNSFNDGGHDRWTK